jgi:hypothetical protein
MAEAIVKLAIADAATARIRTIAGELKDLAKAAKSAGMPDAAVLGRGASQLRNVADNFGSAKREADAAAGGFSKAKEALGAFTNSAGLGFAKSFIGLGGAVAFAAAAGKVIADSIRLASEFERVSQRATYSLALGRGNLAAQVQQLQRASMGYSAYGMNGIQAAEMIGTYGQASGATQGQSIAAGRGIATFSRIMGMDPSVYAGQMGLLSQYAGKDVDANSRAIFGAAQSAGDAGRRPTELLGNVVNLLTQIQASNPYGKDGLKSALSEVVGISNLGGFYQSTQGQQNAMAGANALGSSIGGSPYLTRLALRAGLSLEDIQMGTGNIADISKITQAMYKDTGGNRAIMGAQFSKMGITGNNGRALLDWAMAHQGNLMGASSPMAPAAVQKALKQYQDSIPGQQDRIKAKFENGEITAGDAILKAIIPKLAALTDAFSNFVHTYPVAMGAVAAGLAAVALALALRGKGGPGLPSLPFGGKPPIIPGAGGAGAAAADGAAGGGVISTVAGFVLKRLVPVVGLVLALRGNTETQAEDDSAIAQDSARRDKSFRMHLNSPSSSKIDLKRWLYAIRSRESANKAHPYGDYGVVNSIGAMGAYQFMPDTLMGGYDSKHVWHNGYAQSMDPKLLQKLGRAGFAKHFLADHDMQDRYAANMIQNGFAQGVRNLHDYGAYHLGGYGGLLNLRRGRGDDPRYGDGQSTLNQEGDAMDYGYAHAPSQFISYQAPSAAKSNAHHPAHQNGQHHSAATVAPGHAHVTVPGGHKIKLTATLEPSRTKATTYRN